MATTFTAEVSLEGGVETGDMTITVRQTVSEPVPPEPPEPETGWTPPDWLRTDSDEEEVPDIAPPAYLDEWQDPVFKTLITCITDKPGELIDNISGAGGATSPVTIIHRIRRGTAMKACCSSTPTTV